MLYLWLNERAFLQILRMPCTNSTHFLPHTRLQNQRCPLFLLTLFMRMLLRGKVQKNFTRLNSLAGDWLTGFVARSRGSIGTSMSYLNSFNHTWHGFATVQPATQISLVHLLHFLGLVPSILDVHVLTIILLLR